MKDGHLTSYHSFVSPGIRGSKLSRASAGVP
nr:MAG TPA: hypothetical protein [Caudoviricetes sp.]